MQITTASRPHAIPTSANTGQAREPGVVVRRDVEQRARRRTAPRASPPATLDATTSGTKARCENSKSSSSIASTTAASGAPNVADMPAAAPHASRILRSDGVTRISWPMSDPSAPPVTMIGPSAPNGPPVPIAIAADSGLATRGAAARSGSGG